MSKDRLKPTVNKHAVIICEGASEQGYVRWLQRLAHKHTIRGVRFNEKNIGCGDPLEAVTTAVAEIKRLKADKLNIVWRGVLIDQDSFGPAPEREKEARNLAKIHKLEWLVQPPCHEGFLLKHFEALKTHQPPTEEIAFNHLRKVWPDYKKGMDALGYEKILTIEHLRCARGVWPEFSAMLDAIGWTVDRE
jgi:hypothetical protein